MKKRLYKIICLCFLLMIMTSCGTAENQDTFEYKRESFKLKVKTSIEEDTAIQDENRVKAGITPENVQNVKKQQAKKYAYNVMDPELRELYAEIYIILCNQVDDVKISTDSADDISYVFSCVLADHPEIYWVEGYVFVTHELFGKLSYKTFSGKYIYTMEDRKAFQPDINRYTEMAIGSMKSTMPEYDKVKHVYEYVIKHTEYVDGVQDNQNILSVMRSGKSVCQGYAKTIQYLLNKLDVECCVVTGSAGGEGHAWNLVKIDGVYYYLDATWGDVNYIINNSQSKASIDVNYDYLNITTHELEKDHTINNAFSLPACISVAANYYVKEGLYYSYYSNISLQRVFDQAYKEGRKMVTIKLSDSQILEQYRKELFDNQKIFNYLNTSESVSYTVNEENNTINIWM